METRSEVFSILRAPPALAGGARVRVFAIRNGFAKQALSDMTRLWLNDNAIDVQVDSRGKIFSFTWRGRTHRIQKLHQTWQVDTDWSSDEGEAHREYYALTTTDGLLCVIYKDALNDGWYFAKLYD